MAARAEPATALPREREEATVVSGRRRRFRPGGAMVIGSGLIGATGGLALRRAFPPIPTWAMNSAKEDVRTIAKGAHR